MLEMTYPPPLRPYQDAGLFETETLRRFVVLPLNHPIPVGKFFPDGVGNWRADVMNAGDYVQDFPENFYVQLAARRLDVELTGKPKASQKKAALTGRCCRIIYNVVGNETKEQYALVRHYVKHWLLERLGTATYPANLEWASLGKFPGTEKMSEIDRLCEALDAHLVFGLASLRGDLMRDIRDQKDHSRAIPYSKRTT